MSYGLLLLAAALTCVSARFTVPVPIHYEIEAQFQKQTGVKMRWDPTNYLTYLAAVYAQCSHLYSASSLQTRGRIANSTAYTNLQIYFDPSLLQNNLAVFAWDVSSDQSQDAGTVDRDLRKLFGKSNGAGALSNIANIDTALRTYDRFGCSIETSCRQQQQYVMTFVCVFGLSNPGPKQVSGDVTRVPQPATQATRPAPPVRATTTRPRPTTRAAATTTPARLAAAGLYETYGEGSTEFYEFVINELPNPDTPPQVNSPETVSFEQKITSVGLCKYENNAEGYSADVLKAAGFENDVQVALYGATIESSVTSQDLLSSSPSDAGRNALRSVLGTKLSAELNQGLNMACSFALCSEKLLVGCAVWNSPNYDDAE